MKQRINACGKSDIGLKRTNNEDSLVFKSEAGFFAVADGMGGAASGELASQIFIEATLEIFSEIQEESEEDTLFKVRETFKLANERILTRAAENPEHQGMGCTAELIVFYNEHYVIGHVGDSRTYLLRNGQLRQLTRDHSVVQEQIDKGLIGLSEARRHSLRNVILRAVGVNETLAVDLIRGRSFPGDLFLLCSDGLSDMIEDSSIQYVLSLPLHLDRKSEKLIELAKSAGGYDNITAILCEVLPS